MWCLMPIMLDKCVRVFESNFITIKNWIRVHVHIHKRKHLCTCVYDFTIIYSSCTFMQVNILRKLKCALCKHTLSTICLTFIRTNLEYGCDVLVEHNLQVEIILSMKQGGNVCLLGINIASWQHFTKCLIHYILNIWVIVYLLQYKLSVITISKAK
jgi:hypothetical protein